ncbi:protein CEPU-1-like [Anneissia japonica]|uniref:protein CEPU-1-like n=1 Tax=Anneissia japonica TaxID=1529436 RepID=UPI001425B1E4|nr:protein CEPU-1-like [Anneissia japonica]
MAGIKYTKQSSNLATLESRILLRISVLILVFYVEPNGGRSIDDLVADNLRVNEGDSAVLPCFYFPTNAVIGKWYWKTNKTVIIRSDGPSEQNSRYLLGDATSGNVSLVIKKVLRWDKGTYTCGVNDQSTGSAVPNSDDSKLTVNYLDNPKIKALTDTRKPKGTQVSMSCNVASSNPEVSLLTWFHNGDNIFNDSDKYIFNDEILEIISFDESDEGNYSCRAENKFFFGENGKYSNSITFSFLKEQIPSSSSSSQIWLVFIIIPVLMIGVLVVIARYFLKNREENIHRFDDYINKIVIKKNQKNQINIEPALDDFLPAEYQYKGKQTFNQLSFLKCNLDMLQTWNY